MDAETILEVVKLLTGIMAQTVRSRSRDGVWRFGAWVWGVLGKCRDRTELVSEEIAILRELGKRAVKLVGGIREKASKANNDSQELLEQEDEDSQDSLVPDEPAADIAAQNTGDAEFNIPNADYGLDEPAKDERGAAELEEAKNRLKGYFLSAVDVQSPSAAAAVSGHAHDPLGVNTAQDEVDVDQQIRVILDMILTVVGDFYGQRDLLEFRDIWGEV
jgi:regulator of vacuolar morphogenesis